MNEFSLHQRLAVLKKTILSVSGWRKIFSMDGDPNGMRKDISLLDLEFVLVAAEILREYFTSQNYQNVILGRDSRPTSEVIEANLYSIMSEKLTCKKGISTALPEVMAYCKESKSKTGFIYITASHNPSGYNGFKIGDHQGKVLNQEEISPLIDKFKKSYLNHKTLSLSPKKFPFETSTGKLNFSSRSKYTKLTKKVIAGKRDNVLSSLKQSILTYRPSIVYDFNGSARINSIDIDLLKEFGVNTITLGEKIGHFFHGIVPEGDNLNDLKNALMKFSNQKIIFGIGVDCDGDRGNLVLFNRNQEVFSPDAQSTFLLNVLSELAFLELFCPKAKQKKAVVGNGATSDRIESICSLFDVQFFRSEVGEANIVSLAETLMEQGYFIRILGEGSNGGNIILPSTVRDPLNSIFSILKLIFLKNTKTNKSMLDVVREKLNVSKEVISDHPQYVLAEILSLYRHHQTTPSFSKAGIIKVNSEDQKKLKKNYERLFINDFQKKKTKLKKQFGITHFEIVNYEGIQTRIGEGNRTGNEDGGFKIKLMGKSGQVAFMWMRRSKTEPVFRVMVDIKGKKSHHDEFLSWHQSLLKKADERLTEL